MSCPKYHDVKEVTRRTFQISVHYQHRCWGTADVRTCRHESRPAVQPAGISRAIDLYVSHNPVEPAFSAYECLPSMLLIFSVRAQNLRACFSPRHLYSRALEFVFRFSFAHTHTLTRTKIEIQANRTFDDAGIQIVRLLKTYLLMQAPHSKTLNTDTNTAIRCLEVAK